MFEGSSFSVGHRGGRCACGVEACGGHGFRSPQRSAEVRRFALSAPHFGQRPPLPTFLPTKTAIHSLLSRRTSRHRIEHRRPRDTQNHFFVRMCFVRMCYPLSIYLGRQHHFFVRMYLNVLSYFIFLSMVEDGERSN